MGRFTFRWEHPAEEVWVTGTFDNWSKSTRLDRVGTAYQKTVELPNDKIFYKFVADGDWKYDHTAKSETDHEGNVNNVLYPNDMQPSEPFISSVAPGATTAALAGEQPLEPTVSAPGAFPETPAADESQNFSVKPIPATGGVSNPIQLAPGEPVPDPSTLTGNTVESNVKLDKESYEQSDATAPVAPVAALGGASAPVFGLGPQTTNIIPESGMPRGADTPADISTQDIGPNVSSVGPNSTTAALAGQVPKEPRGTATVVDDNAGATDDNSWTAKATAGAAAVGVAAAGAAVAANELVKDKTGVDAKSKLPESVQKTIDNSAAGSAAPGETASNVPAEVSESQKEALAAPEASANPVAVNDKSAFEKELLSEVKTTDATGEPAPTISAATATSAPATTTESAAPAAATTSVLPLVADKEISPAKTAAPQLSVTGAPQIGHPTGGGLDPLTLDSKPGVDSRDISPMTKPSTATQTQPVVTTGVKTGTAPAESSATSAPSTPAKGQSSLLKGTSDSTKTSGTPDSKKEKRKGFFGKIKDKLKA